MDVVLVLKTGFYLQTRLEKSQILKMYLNGNDVAQKVMKYYRKFNLI